MTADVELLPLPEGEAIGWTQAWSYDQMRTYARANVEHRTAAKDAEIEALRAEVERLTALTAVTMGVGRGDGSLFVHGDYDSIKAAQALVFRAERLAEALRAAERSLRTIADGAGRAEFLEDTGDVRGYANSRANAALAALHPTAAQESKDHG